MGGHIPHAHGPVWPCRAFNDEHSKPAKGKKAGKKGSARSQLPGGFTPAQEQLLMGTLEQVQPLWFH